MQIIRRLLLNYNFWMLITTFTLFKILVSLSFDICPRFKWQRVVWGYGTCSTIIIPNKQILRFLSLRANMMTKSCDENIFILFIIYTCNLIEHISNYANQDTINRTSERINFRNKCQKNGSYKTLCWFYSVDWSKETNH